MAYDPAIPDLDHYVGDDIPAIAANFVALAPLVPHIATLLDSRIVEHNLDDEDPAGGFYVRWASGFQLVMTTVTVDTTANTAHMFTAPANFRANTPKVATHSFVSLTSAANRQAARAVLGVGVTLGTPSTYYVATDGTGTLTDFPVHVAIFGLW